MVSGVIRVCWGKSSAKFITGGRSFDSTGCSCGVTVESEEWVKDEVLGSSKSCTTSTGLTSSEHPEIASSGMDNGTCIGDTGAFISERGLLLGLIPSPSLKFHVITEVE